MKTELWGTSNTSMGEKRSSYVLKTNHGASVAPVAKKVKPKTGWAFSYWRTLALSVVTMTEAKLNKQHYLFLIFTTSRIITQINQVSSHSANYF
jgi:hypothetical protein